MAVVGAVVVAGVALTPGAGARPQSRLHHSSSDCGALVAEATQAKADLAKLIASQQNGGATATTTPEIASYVASVIASASINAFGFVSADAGAPLELCVPAGTTALTMYSTPVVLWTGSASTTNYPVDVVIPAGVDCGTHTLRATGNGVDQSVQFAVNGQCTKVLGVTISNSLSRTGAEIGRALAVALSLLAIGFAVVVAGRSRASRAGTTDS